MNFKWINVTLIGLFVVILGLGFWLRDDLGIKGDRGTALQGIASMVSMIATLLLLGFTYFAHQRSRQAEGEAREVIENAKKQAEAMEALAQATHEQSQILQEGKKPHVVLELKADHFRTPGTGGAGVTPALTGFRLVNLSDGLIHVEHAEYWQNHTAVKALTLLDNQRTIQIGGALQLEFWSGGGGQMRENHLMESHPLGVPWTVNFRVVYTYQKTGGVEHAIAGAFNSMEGQDETLKFYRVDWVSEDQRTTTRYRIHEAGAGFQSEKFT